MPEQSFRQKMKLDNFSLGLYNLNIRPVDNLSLPAYKGATFRGGFGYAFKKVVCSVRNKQCPECIFKDKCIYAYVFETPLPPDAKMMRKYPQVPHPFIIEPPVDNKPHYTANDKINFNLILIGRAIEYLPYFIYTFEELGKMGLGKGRRTYNLIRVNAMDISGRVEKIYSSHDKTIKSKYPVIAFKDIAGEAEKLPADRLTVLFQTPTRLKFEGALTGKITFDIIIRNLLRRISALSYFHCGEELELDFKEVIEKSKNIKLDKSGIKWFDWERYSTRQNTRMKLGGIIGEASFSGDLKEFLPLLKLGELVHIGKGTSFGLGKYVIRRSL